MHPLFFLVGAGIPPSNTTRLASIPLCTEIRFTFMTCGKGETLCVFTIAFACNLYRHMV